MGGGLMNVFMALLGISDYPPLGQLYPFPPGFLWAQVVADGVIALSFFMISMVLVYILKRRTDLKFPRIMLLFSAFIFCCGLTHLVSVINIWFGLYAVHSFAKVVTATVSFVAVVALLRRVRVILSIPSLDEYRRLEVKASEEEFRRKLLEIEQRSEHIFRFSLELFPTGLLVVDGRQRIRIVNDALETMFGYDPDELIGQPLSILLAPEQVTHHALMVDEYLHNPEQRHVMSSGRLVSGKTKQGKDIAVEVALSAHDWEGDTHSFASVVNVGEVRSEGSRFFANSNRLKRVIDATHDGIWEWNLQNRDTWLSQRMKQMLGLELDRDESLLAAWRAHVHPEDRRVLRMALRQHLRSRSPLDVTYRGLCQLAPERREYVWLQLRGDSIFDAEGRAILMSGTLTNIDTVKKLELEYARKTQFLDAVLQKSLSGIHIFDAEHLQDVYINEQYSHITGYRLEEIREIQKREGITTLLHPDDISRMLDHIQRVITSQNDQSHVVEFRFRHKSGHWIWCVSRDTPYRLGQESTKTQLLGSLVDVSPLKKREEKIRELAQEYSTTFELAAVGIAHVSLLGRWLKVNDKVCEILGYSERQLLDMTFQELTYPDDLDEDLNFVDRLIEGERDSYSTEKRYIRSDGNLIWVNLTVSIVRSENGENQHFISLLEDITERKNVVQALADSNASLERFAYSASHDLQEPLRKITSFADLLKLRFQDGSLSPEASYELQRIGDAARRMREMIDSLLQLSRYSRGVPDRQPVLLSVLVAATREDLSDLLQEAQAQVELRQDISLNVDKAAFLQVLYNLVSNSIRYARPTIPPHIVIDSEQSPGTQTLTVTDNGCGFDNRYASHIFEPFQRLVSKAVPGHGMGLAICQQIVTAHQGRMFASSEVNQGTTFTIQLPVGGAGNAGN